MAGQRDQLEDRVEKIVREVLAGLQTNGRPPEAVGPRPASLNQDTQRVGQNGRPAALVLTDRVVTLAALDGQLQGVKEVRVPNGAVVTPAVRDLLRERGVSLSQNDGLPASRGLAAIEIVVGVAVCRAEPVSARRLREVLQTRIEMMPQVGLVEMVREMAEQIALGGRKGILFTSEAAAGLCLANRSRGVRAIGGRSADEVAKTAASLGANLLVSQPDGLTSWSQLQTAKAFVDCGVIQCPAEYAAALG